LEPALLREEWAGNTLQLFGDTLWSEKLLRQRFMLRFEVLATVTTNITIVWNVTSCSLAD